VQRTRLLTLVGAGGVGKTRLGLRLASTVRAAYADGVCLVELASVAEPGRVPATVAAALGLRPSTDDVLDVLVEQVRERQVLLVLDNCEHLVGACALLVERLLQAGPDLRVLATSREPLGVPGEVAWPVPTLSLPERSSVHAREELERSEAGRLFLERALASRPDLVIDAVAASRIAEICAQVDGLPLALELAAARLRTLGLDDLLAGDDAADEEAERLLAEREEARAAKDFATADARRDRLAELGWDVRDTPAGAQLVRREP
jgi:predicted ATPase